MQATQTSFRPSRNSLIATALLVAAALAAGAALLDRPATTSSAVATGTIEATAPVPPVGDLHATRDPSVPSAKSVFDDSHGAIEEPPVTH